MRAPFGTRLRSAMDARGPLCVGIDPHPELLSSWGLPDDAGGVERFALTCIEAFGGDVAVCKPQSAFFEVYGAAGIAVLERTIAAAHGAGTLVVLDVKRGDVGSTTAAYARAYLADGAPLAVDAVTLSPYLGVGALEPATTLALATGRGVFVLAATSNPEGAMVQEAMVHRAGARHAGAPRARSGDDVSVAQAVVDSVALRNAGAARDAAVAGDVAAPGSGPDRLGSLGVVVGATVEHGLDLGALHGPVLAPGLGAQGASAADLLRRFSGLAGALLPTTSRAVLRHGPDVAALRSAARRAREEIGGTGGG